MKMILLSGAEGVHLLLCLLAPAFARCQAIAGMLHPMHMHSSATAL